jgi:predicted signal transduction protein with EAL and GGDEF domain
LRLVVTASVGVAMGERATAEELLRHADIAMYRAKWEGKNGYVVFEPGMEDAVQSILRDADDNEGLIVCKPTFEVTDTAVMGTRAPVVRRLPRITA